MKNKIITIAVLAGSLFVSNALSAQNAVPPERPQLPDEIKQLIQDFRTQRVEMLQLRQQLMEQLRNCTEEERAEIIAEFRQANQERVRAERELRKAIHEQMRQIRIERRTRTGPGAGG